MVTLLYCFTVVVQFLLIYSYVIPNADEYNVRPFDVYDFNVTGFYNERGEWCYQISYRGKIVCRVVKHNETFGPEDAVDVPSELGGPFCCTLGDTPLIVCQENQYYNAKHYNNVVRVIYKWLSFAKTTTTPTTTTSTWYAGLNSYPSTDNALLGIELTSTVTNTPCSESGLMVRRVVKDARESDAESNKKVPVSTTLSSTVDTAHRDIIHDAQLNYYGNRLATCSSDRTIKVFDVKPNGTTYPVAELTGHAGPVWQLSWSHPRFQGVLASAGYDKKVIIWSESGGKFQKSYEWTGHEASVNSVAFGPHQFGLILATASADSSIAILSFNANSGEWISSKILKAHEQGVNAVSWAPAVNFSADRPYQKRIASCGNDNLIKIWVEDEHGEWRCERQLQGHGDFVRDVAWCPQVNNLTHTIASCGQDRNVLLWRCNDISQGDWTPKLIEKAEGALWHVNWSLCGTMLSVSGEDNQVSLWKENLQGQWFKVHEN